MEEIRAQKGVPMALMNGFGVPYQWDGATMRNLDGEELPMAAFRLDGGQKLYTIREPEWIRVLPPLDEPEPAIVVGSQWRRNSDGKQCVVTFVNNVGDVWVRYKGFNGKHATFWGDSLLSLHTHLYTPAPDLSNMSDGDRIVCAETGEVVRVEGYCESGGGGKWLKGLDDEMHSVNGLPAYVHACPCPYRAWWHHGNRHRWEGAAIMPIDGDNSFWLDSVNLTPEEWGKAVVAAGRAHLVLPEYRYLLPLDEPEPAEAVTVGYAVEPPKPDTKALLIAKAIADLELVCKDITKPVGSHVAKNRYRVCADYVVRIRRVIKTLKETSDD